ncbi:MAG: zf-HC2 domain-containing protein [Phycisphaerales bacterium]|nr:zf-HC2 domain-containing protein [Phycisphaerales bacterium]
MTDGHLTEAEIADWLAAGDTPSDRPAAIQRHVETCATCRLRIDRADAVLQLASLQLESQSLSGDCPDAMTLAAYLDDKLAGARLEATRSHVADCESCRDVCRYVADAGADVAPRRAIRRIPALRLWTVGLATLATAATIMIVTMWPRDAWVAGHVRVFEPEVTRSGAQDGNESDFEVTIRLRRPAWVSLLVADDAGRITLLENKEVEDTATFGRFAVMAPDADRMRRRYAIILVSPTSLADRLADVDVAPVELGDVDATNDRRVAEWCAKLAGALDCEAHYLSMTNGPASE